MSLDYVAIVSDEGAKIAQAYERDSRAPVPWSDRWSVGTVARHVAGTHHVVADIVRGRPSADFGLFGSLQTPAKDAPEFPEWFRSGTASLVGQLDSVAPDEECWSWYSDGRQVGWWARRMAFETVVHRWDVEAAQGTTGPIAADVAADGIDEYLDVFVAASRAGNNSPAGPVIGIECTDRADHWSLDLGEQGARKVTTDSGDATVRIRGSAENLLLIVWGRIGLADGNVETGGDTAILERWTELIPPM